MKRTVTITETKEVEMEIEVPPFFKNGNRFWYMANENGTYTQVYVSGTDDEDASINRVSSKVAFSVSDATKEITMEEFYSKLNEAFNILSIGSHELKEAADNNFSQAAHEDLLQAHGHESAEFSC